jgi:hypothetical protein
MDGTFIRYYGDLNYGTLYYADGTRMSYSSGGSSTGSVAKIGLGQGRP